MLGSEKLCDDAEVGIFVAQLIWEEAEKRESKATRDNHRFQKAVRNWVELVRWCREERKGAE